MIGFVKFNNNDIVGDLSGREFDFINKKNNRPYKTIVFCGQNGGMKTTFINYFRMTKNNEKINNYYEEYIDKRKWIIEEKFMQFKYYKNDEYKEYKAYYPIFFNKFFKYPLSTIHDNNEFINDNKWCNFSNLFFVDFSNQKRSNQTSFRYPPIFSTLKKDNYNKTQFQENEDFLLWLNKNFYKNTYKIHKLIKITNWVLFFLQTKLMIMFPGTTYIQEFYDSMGIEKNGNDHYHCRWFNIKKNKCELQPNELSTGEWQLIMNIMILTKKIIEFYENNVSSNEHPIVFIDQPEDNLNPKIQIKLVELYQMLRRVWNIQFFIITHSIYFIKYFVIDNEAIVYNFDNYKSINLDDKENEMRPLVVYELNNSKNISFDEICYLFDQIPTPNYYCNLFEYLNHHSNKKYKERIEHLIDKVYLDLKISYGLINVPFRKYRNYFIHQSFEKNKKIVIKIEILKKCINFFREILFNELKK